MARYEFMNAWFTGPAMTHLEEALDEASPNLRRSDHGWWHDKPCIDQPGRPLSQRGKDDVVQ